MEGLLIGAIFLLILWVISVSRNTAEVTPEEQQNAENVFTTPLPYAVVWEEVVAFSQRSGLNLEDFQPEAGKLVLGENLSLVKNHNGFILPIFVRSQEDGTTSVQVDVHSKTYQLGFLLRPYRDNALNQLKAEIKMREMQTQTSSTDG